MAGGRVGNAASRARDRQRLRPFARHAPERPPARAAAAVRVGEPGDARADELAAGDRRRRHPSPLERDPRPGPPEDRLAARRGRRRRLRARRPGPPLRRRRDRQPRQRRTRPVRRSRRCAKWAASDAARALAPTAAAPARARPIAPLAQNGLFWARVVASEAERRAGRRSSSAGRRPTGRPALPPIDEASAPCSRGSTAASAADFAEVADRGRSRS